MNLSSRLKEIVYNNDKISFEELEKQMILEANKKNVYIDVKANIVSDETLDLLLKEDLIIRHRESEIDGRICKVIRISWSDYTKDKHLK